MSGALDDGWVNVPLGGHVLDLDTSDGGFLRNGLGILNSGIFGFVLLHLFMHDGLGLLDDLVQEHNCTLSGAHAVNETEVYVLEAVGPGELQELENFEELGCVEILCGGDDVDHLVELILVVSLNGASDITGEVDGSAIWNREPVSITAAERT